MMLSRRMLEDDRGATLVEFTVIAALLLGMTFALVDFGRAYFQWVMAEKAMQIAGRMAAMRPPACAGVPTLNARGTDRTLTFGTACSVTGACLDAGAVSCTGSADSATVAAILARLAPMLPRNTTPANFTFRYEYARLGFLGGPYVPMVTVELQNVNFEFIALGPFVGLLGGEGFTSRIAMPSMRTTVPAEDLAAG